MAAVKAYNSLLPLYREDLEDVLLDELKWIRALKKDPIYQGVVATRNKLMAEKLMAALMEAPAAAGVVALMAALVAAAALMMVVEGEFPDCIRVKKCI